MRSFSAVALRVPLDGSEPERAIVEALVQAGPMLLVLDRIDDVRKPLVQRLARWQAAAPELRVLCTSRQALSMPSETVVELGPLSTQAAMELFRSRAVREVPSGWDAKLEALVARLDHHPLAIELVAASRSR